MNNIESIEVKRLESEQVLLNGSENCTHLRYIENPVKITTTFIISEAEYEKLLYGSQKKNKDFLEHIRYIIKSSASHTKIP